MLPIRDDRRVFSIGDRDGGRGGYGGGDRFGDKKMGPGGDFNPEFQRVRSTRSLRFQWDDTAVYWE